MKTASTKQSHQEQYFVASQWQLMWRKFKKHRLAIVAGGILALLYTGALVCEFLAPYEKLSRRTEYIYMQPQRLHFIDEEGFHLRPFVYGVERRLDLDQGRRVYTEDRMEKYFVKLVVHGDPYKFWGIVRTDLHLFGVDKPGVIFLWGTDKLGRDLFSRNLYASRISLSVGLVGVVLSFILGSILGGISGYFGGRLDTIIQRVVEFLISIPTLPLWMSLSAALPPRWPPVRIYFGITIILSIIGWCGLARVVRGKFLELREEDFVMAARLSGAPTSAIIGRHLLPSFLSYLIVSLTLAIPNMILGETALSFLGLGLRAPVVSWGVLLQSAQNFRTVATNSWLLIPAIFVIITVLAFNFLGDGLRDAADPYK